MMKGFRFPLQSVLDVKRHKEDGARHALERVEQAFTREEAALEDIRRRQARCFSSIRETLHATVSAELALVFMHYRDYLGKRLDLQQTRVVQARKQVEQARRSLLAAAREKKTLERLKERQYEAYRSEMRRVEQNRLDEMASRIAFSGKRMTVTGGGRDV